MQVDILGTKYTVKEDRSLRETDADGLCKCYSKEILYRALNDLLCSDDSVELKDNRRREVIRHEIIHAFFFESGLVNYSEDELLVDWLAKQFPKILLAMKRAGGVCYGEMGL